MPQSGHLDRFRLEVPGKSLCRPWLHSRLSHCTESTSERRFDAIHTLIIIITSLLFIIISSCRTITRRLFYLVLSLIRFFFPHKPARL